MVATTWAWLAGYAGIVWPFRAEDNGVSLAWKPALANTLPLPLLVSKKPEPMATSRRVHVMAARC